LAGDGKECATRRALSAPWSIASEQQPDRALAAIKFMVVISYGAPPRD
jgi:hypothetical protein